MHCDVVHDDSQSARRNDGTVSVCVLQAYLSKLSSHFSFFHSYIPRIQLDMLVLKPIECACWISEI
jgi:hypothetical protein